MKCGRCLYRTAQLKQDTIPCVHLKCKDVKRPLITHLPVHVWKKLVLEPHFTLAPLSARVIALHYLELHVQSKIYVPKIRVSWCWAMSIVSFRTKQDKVELWKQMVTVTSIVVAIAKFLFGMCDCKVDSNVGTIDFSLVLRILYVCRLQHVPSHVSPGMDWFSYLLIYLTGIVVKVLFFTHHYAQG